MRIPILVCGLSLAAGSFLGLAAPPESAEAGTAVRLELEGLVEHSSLIVEGVVQEARVLDFTNEGRIETEYVLDLERTFWGDPREGTSIRLPGGTLPDGSGMVVPGIPHVQEGERVVLFLTEPSQSGMRMPVGLSQGKFRIASTPGVGTWAIGGGGAMRTVDPVTGEEQSGGNARMLEYADFVARVEAAVSSRQAREAGNPEEK